MEREIIKQYFKLAEKKTCSMRNDVEKIRGRLRMVSNQLEKNLFDENNISTKIKEVRSAQESFHDRIEQMGQTLRACKTLLASFH